MRGVGGWILFALGGLAALGVGLWLAFARPAPAPPGGRPPYVVPVELAEVQRRDLQPRVRLTGTVRSLRRAELAFEVPGRVVELSVREADRVEAGQVLARLDERDARLGVAMRTAELAQRAQELARLEAGERREVIERLRAELEVAKAEEELARLEVERSRTLLRQSVVSQADLDRAVAALQAAGGRRQAAAQRLAEAEAGSRVEDIAVARARRDLAQEALAMAERELDKTALRAPWDGAVVRLPLRAGDHVIAGEPVLELVDPGELEVELRIPARHAHRLGERPRLTIRADELPELTVETELDARVPLADRLSRNVTALARVPAGTLLEPGMFVRVELALRPLPDALVVPSDALRTMPQGTMLVRADEAAGEGGSPTGLAAGWVPVTALGEADGASAVRPLGEATLEPGQRVVTTGVDLAFPGAPLAPRAPAPAGDSAGGGSGPGSGS